MWALLQIIGMVVLCYMLAARAGRAVRARRARPAITDAHRALIRSKQFPRYQFDRLVLDRRTLVRKHLVLATAAHPPDHSRIRALEHELGVAEGGDHDPKGCSVCHAHRKAQAKAELEERKKANEAKRRRPPGADPVLADLVAVADEAVAVAEAAGDHVTAGQIEAVRTAVSAVDAFRTATWNQHVDERIAAMLSMPLVSQVAVDPVSGQVRFEGFDNRAGELVPIFDHPCRVCGKTVRGGCMHIESTRLWDGKGSPL